MHLLGQIPALNCALYRCCIRGADSLMVFRSYSASRANVNAGKGMKQPEDIQQPQDDCDDYDTIQNGLDRSLHGDEAIHQPQQDANYNENLQ